MIELLLVGEVILLRWPVAVRAIVVLGSLRIFDIMQRVMNVTLMEGVGESRARVASFTRSVVLALVNFGELCACFGVIYAADYERLNGAGQPLSGLYFSVITQLTIGYGDIYPTGRLRVVAAVQGLVAVVFVVLVFARVVQSLPPRQAGLNPTGMKEWAVEHANGAGAPRCRANDQVVAARGSFATLDRPIGYMASSEHFVSRCLIGLALALLVVGVVSGTILRHVIQILPIIVAVGVLTRWPDWGAYAAVPIFLFWTFIVGLTWLFLLGVSRIANGHYTLIEIVSTFFMAGFSVAGVVKSVSLGKALRPIGRVLTIMLFAVLQVAAMWVSFLKPIVNR